MAKKSDPNQLLLALELPTEVPPLSEWDVAGSRSLTNLPAIESAKAVAAATVANSNNGAFESQIVELEPIADCELLSPTGYNALKDKGDDKLESEELRHRSERALKYEDRAEASVKALIKCAVLAFLLKLGVPVSNALTAHYRLPQMDGTLVSGALAIACMFHFINALRFTLWARENTYQRQFKFVQLSWSGRFAVILDKASAGALLLLFVTVMLLTAPDIIATVSYLIEFLSWIQGTTTVPTTS
jgi:succinate dehydrogenase/fumarate reductase cytochrome b subunit